MRTLSWWLRRYYKLQDDIIVVYRPTLKSWWGDRCLYKSEEYIPAKQYNHRSILDKEIVIEFDQEDKKLNISLILLYEDLLSAIDRFIEDIRNNQEASDIFWKAFKNRREPDEENKLRNKQYDRDLDFIYSLLA